MSAKSFFIPGCSRVRTHGHEVNHLMAGALDTRFVYSEMVISETGIKFVARVYGYKDCQGESVTLQGSIIDLLGKLGAV